MTRRRIADSDDDFEEDEEPPARPVHLKFDGAYITDSGRTLRERRSSQPPRALRSTRHSKDASESIEAKLPTLNLRRASTASKPPPPPQDASDDLGGYDPPSEAPFRPVGATVGPSREVPTEPVVLSGSEFDAEQDAQDSEDAVKRNGSDDDDYYDQDSDGPIRPLQRQSYVSKSGRSTTRKIIHQEDSDDEPVRTPRKRRTANTLGGFVLPDSEEDSEADYEATRQQRRERLREMSLRRQQEQQQQAQRSRPSKKRTTRNSKSTLLDDDKDYSADDTLEDNAYSFRRRKTVNYTIPTIDQIVAESEKSSNVRKDRLKIVRRPKGLPLSMTGKQLDKLFGGKPDSSDDDFATPRKRFGVLGGAGGMMAGAGAFDASGAPSNLGRIGGASLADIDPLLPSNPVTFDSVGGMQDHIQKLKEMVSLPLLYPEVFQRFNITPPRGVLFHGPPGTGKTLLARALAASCSTGQQKISFFMRKGADCLSKWVGEAERQLRLLFEEAKQSQPSIIFFDEIDGLAPVRSSKQEQIHASIVSTLLALMDGMDGRGQVVVIGATNRPDAIDPALRRPGRFDREFYFPLPNREARRQIIDIHTKDWQPGLTDGFKDELALLTKGYGGADMRALCTEAALNAVQRRYPQIYKSDDRLLIKPETIEVSARDFVLSAKNLIPSTARSTSSLASPLPDHLKPLLNPAVESAKTLLERIMPSNKKMSILEEAEYEEDPDATFTQQKLLQTFETARIYKPRLLILGQPGMGQSRVGAAILHHLDGYQVQPLDLSTLVSDSTRSPEATVAQLFVEAKRHKPSIIFIPSLKVWCDTVSEQVRGTMTAMLENSLESGDAVLLMALADCSIEDLPPDVRSWFGFLKDNKLQLTLPTLVQRREFFEDVMKHIRLPPSQFPDALPRKKRQLEVLPKAPPPPPRQMTEAELRQQHEADLRLREYLKFKLGPIISELRKRFKRFCRPIGDDYVPPPPAASALHPDEASHVVDVDAEGEDDIEILSANPQLNGDVAHANGHQDASTMEQPVATEVVPSGTNGVDTPSLPNGALFNATQQADAPDGALQPEPPLLGQSADLQDETKPHEFVNIDLDVINHDLYYDQYLTPGEFLADVHTIVANASLDSDPEQSARAGMMLNYATVMCDQACDPQFRHECERMAARERDRLRKRKGKGKEVQVNPSGAEPPPRTEGPAEGGSATSTLSTSTSKRLREGEMEEDPTSKRARLDSDGFVDAAPATSRLEEQPNTTTAPGSTALPDPTTQPMQVDKEHQEPEPAVPIYPDFIVPEGELLSLSHNLELRTSAFTIDQLEQLRAVLTDLIWQRRSDWDRTRLVDECREALTNFAGEVDSWQQAQADQD